MIWKKLIEGAVADRRRLHTMPELCWQEKKTHDYIAARLNQLGVSWRRCASTGLVAQIGKNATGEHLCFRCDMDGLEMEEKNSFSWVSSVPHRMHGCGHDGHMATLLGALAWLKKREEAVPGPITFIFQPAEEGGHGAREMIADGALDGVDRIYGWHNWPAIGLGKAVCGPGVIMAANASFQIKLQGKGGHASQPEICKDPVLAAAAVTLALQQVVTKGLAPQKAGVLSVTSVDARSSETIIPDSALVSGSVRMADSTDIVRVGEKIAHIAHSVAAGYGVEAEVRYVDRYHAVVNEAESSIKFAGALQKILGDEYQCGTTQIPIMASEDFSYYLEKVPGAYALIGAGDNGRFSIPCHNVCYDFNDMLIEPMIRVIIRLAGLPS